MYKKADPMFFRPLQTVAQRVSAEESRMRFGGFGSDKAPASDAFFVREHDAARARLVLSEDMLTLEDASTLPAYTAAEYASLARRREAVLFEIPELGYATLPKWGFDDKGGVNHLTLAVAKLFADYRAGAEAAAFCRFVDTTYVTVDATHTKAKDGLSAFFGNKASGKIGLTLTLKDVLGMEFDDMSENGKTVVAQVKSLVDGSPTPLRWPASRHTI